MPEPKRTKVYVAGSVNLTSFFPGEHDHRASNGNAQKFVMIRTTSKKRFAEIVSSTVRHLNRYGGLRILTNNPQWQPIAEHEDAIYYQPKETRLGWVKGWFIIKNGKQTKSTGWYPVERVTET